LTKVQPVKGKGI